MIFICIPYTTFFLKLSVAEYEMKTRERHRKIEGGYTQFKTSTSQLTGIYSTALTMLTKTGYLIFNMMSI